MNTKQVAPIVASISPAISVMPPLLIVGGLVALAIWLLSDDDKKNKPDIAPVNAETENSRKVAETTAFRQIPVKIRVRVRHRVRPEISGNSQFSGSGLL